MLTHSLVCDIQAQAGADLSVPDALSGFAVPVDFYRAASLRTQTASRSHMLALLTMLLVDEAMHAVSNVGQSLLDSLHFGNENFPMCHLLCLRWTTLLSVVDSEWFMQGSGGCRLQGPQALCVS